MAKKHWTTAKRITQDITGDLKKHFWQELGKEGNDSEGSENFAGTYEWNILGGAASDATMQTIAKSVAGDFLGVAGAFATGVKPHKALLKARALIQGSGKSSRPIELHCSRLQLRIEKRDGKSTEWFRVKLYAGNNGDHGTFINQICIFKGAYLYNMDTLYMGKGNEIKKQSWRGRS